MKTELQWSEILAQAIEKPGLINEAYRAFHKFSVGNQLAATVQLVTRGLPISPIASYKTWLSKGRQVKKGEKAISLCMPVTCKGERENKLTGEKEEFSFSRFVWRPNWFSLDQTEGEPQQAPTIPDWDKSAALSLLDIKEVAYEELSGNRQGYAIRREFAVNPLAALPHKTMFHELAHIVIGHTDEGDMTDSEITPRDIKEVEAESVAMLICASLDLPGEEFSRGYIQAWSRGNPIPEKSAQKIFACANKIIKAGQPSHSPN